MADIIKQAEGAPGAGGSSMSFFILMLGLFAIMYFFMIRPQQKQRKELKKQLDAMKKGDKVLTVGGIYGTVVKINNETEVVTAEIAKDTQVEMVKTAIHQVIPKGSSEEN